MKTFGELMLPLANTALTGYLFIGALGHPDATLTVYVALGTWFVGNVLGLVSLFTKEKTDDVQREDGPGK